MIAKLLGWLGRKAVLYVVLVIAIGIATIFAPWVKQVIAGSTSTQVRSQALGVANRTIAEERDEAIRAFHRKGQLLRGEGAAQLHARMQRLEAERSDLRKQLGDAKSAWVLALLDRAELLANERRRLRIAVIEQEVAVIMATLAGVDTNTETLAAAANLDKQNRRVAEVVGDCNTTINAKRLNERNMRWRLGGKWIESTEHEQLVRAETSCRAEVDRSKRQRNLLMEIKTEKVRLQSAAQNNLQQATSDTDRIANVGLDLAADAERARVDLAGSIPERVRVWSDRWNLAFLLKAAAFALVIVIATPFLVRIFCYFILAPIAMRRPPIRLRLPEGGCVPVPPAAQSTTSVAVRLDSGEELLVRQGYFQTGSLATKPTMKWVLNWWRLFTSIASGLTFLVRIRGDGETTTISAIGDGLAEVTILTLPEGTACVLQPRALAAVVQPIRRPLRISRHWRLGSLNAWLTLQLRYLVFHGPAKLVLKGGRGVRVEAAEEGRVFGQDQLVGFSADLAYSVTRTEPFWPYFFGHQPLLKDRVMAGEGVLIIEEAPLTTRNGTGRRGLEGMIDAGMKAFGM